MEQGAMAGIRHYLLEIARKSGISSNGEWSARSGVDVAIIDAFLGGGDIALSDLDRLAGAAKAVIMPMTEMGEDEAYIVMEKEGIYAPGASDPFDKYRDM